MAHPHVAAAKRYARGVVRGKVVAGRLARLACRRFLADLERKPARDWPWRFDADRAEAACEFAEVLPHWKGEWAQIHDNDPDSVLIRLSPWQKFIRCNIFGWVHTDTGLRRFLVAYEEVARKNGKTTDAATIALHGMLADGEPGAEVYCAAVSQDQAMHTFRNAREMAIRAPGFAEHFGVHTDNMASLYNVEAGSRLEPLIGKPRHGSNPHFAIVDEFHEHKTPDAYDTMRTGMQARRQPLLLVTTTAGADTGGPCYDLRDQVVKMLEGTVPNERLFGIIYTIDPEDDWTDPKVLGKANPNLGVSISEEKLRVMLEEAKVRASKQNTFKNLHLNVWTTAREAYFNLEEWARCADPDMRVEDFSPEDGWRCVVSVDLAFKRDLAAAQRLFWRTMDDGKLEYALFSRFYLPEETVQRPDNDRYRGWVNAGAICETKGNETDFSVIEDDILAWQGEHGFDEMAYDPAHALYFRQRLQTRGVDCCIEYRNTTLTMSEPMKEMDAAIGAGRFRHDANPCMDWQISCVTNKRDKKGNDFPNVDRPEHKKDGPVATIMGVGRAQAAEPEEESIYEMGPI